MKNELEMMASNRTGFGTGLWFSDIEMDEDEGIVKVTFEDESFQNHVFEAYYDPYEVDDVEEIARVKAMLDEFIDSEIEDIRYERESRKTIVYNEF